MQVVDYAPFSVSVQHSASVNIQYTTQRNVLMHTRQTFGCM